jgi:uncharacterized membrane protein YfcA
MANDFIKLSPLMAIGVIALVVAFVSGYSGYKMWQDHKPSLEHAIHVAFTICAGSVIVAVLCIWKTRRRWLGQEDD